MKNFTNKFKQFTSRLSARWLIMALMLLLGTSSAWAAQFETNGTALSIKLNTSNDNYNYGLSGHDVTELNVVSGPIHIKETYIHVDKSIGGDFCGAELRIIDGGGDRKVGDFGHQSDDANSRQTWKWSGDFEVKPITEGNHTFQIYVKGNFCNEYKYLSNGGSNYSFSYTIEATDPCATTYYLKHAGWSNGNWGWSDAMTCNDGIYTLEANYNGSGCNYNTKKDDDGAGWIPNLNNPNKIQSGTLCIFTFDPSGPSITITPKCTTANFSVSLPSNGVVNKGDANIKASVDGTHSPAVTWSSSEEEVATIDANGNITAIKGGVTTISATTTGTDSYCKGTKKDAELTVKETPTITISGDTYGCNEEKVLTANFSVGTSYSIRWYKDEVTTPANAIGTSSTVTTKGTGIYYAKITGTYINDATSEGFEFYKYTPAEAPLITIDEESICAGESTNITITDYSTDNNYTLYKGNNAVQNPTFSNGVFTVSEAGTYYVTSTPKEGDCTLESAKQATGLTLSVTEVTISLDPTSAPICSGTTLANIETYVDITTNGNKVAWFEANSGGVALNEADEIRQATYYAEATLNGCTSERVAFNVTELLNVPAKPVITPSDAAICSGNTVTLTLTEKVDGETYKIDDISVFTSSKTYTPTLNETTTYTITATNQCGSTNSELVTINVTTTPVITANKLVTTIGSPITLTSNNIDAIWTTTGGILNPNSGATSSVEFTSQNNGRYTITASNTANDITCSASIEVSVQNAFYVYIRRPKSGDNVYNDWYGKTNDAEKGNAPWFKEGTPNYDSMEDTNYGGVGPVESFTDCNDYTWDAFEFAGGNFYIHAPNTGGSDGWATFTKQTYIESLSGDVYYYISSFTGGEKGSVLSESATTPERAPEIITPVTSLNPASGILCSGSQATLTVTNPQNDYTYTLMYKGTAQGEPISGNNEVEFTVIEAGSYAVQAKVQSNSGCTSTASSSASQIKVIATDIKFDATEYTTTPWVPVTVVIEVPSGYEFTYNDATLTSITPEADKPIKKENGHEYTYTFPRPTDWGIGNSQSGDGYDEKPYTITATIKNAEQCGTATATVKLQDEGNDNCTLPNQ